MDTVKEMIKRAGWRVSLIPFFKCVCVYFIACAERQEAEGGGEGGAVAGGEVRQALQIVAKCAPIVCLIFFVLMQRLEDHNTPLSRRYCTLVSVGLALSCVGDACLAWRGGGGEAAGMAAFGGAHLAYIAAFNAPPPFRPAPALALLLFTIAGIYSSFLRPPLALRYLVPMYTFLLASMAWRALARAIPPPQGAPAAPPSVPLSARAAAAGALAFLLSDCVLAYSMFNGPVPCRQFVVMSTYYVAQLGIAMSAAEFSREQRDLPPPPRSPRLASSDSALPVKSATNLAPEPVTDLATELPEIAAQ